MIREYIDFTGRAAPVPIDATLQMTWVIPQHEAAAIALGGGPAYNKSGLTTTLVRPAFFDGATIGAYPPFPVGRVSGLTVTDPREHIGVQFVRGTALNQLSDLQGKAGLLNA